MRMKHRWACWGVLFFHLVSLHHAFAQTIQPIPLQSPLQYPTSPSQAPGQAGANNLQMQQTTAAPSPIPAAPAYPPQPGSQLPGFPRPGSYPYPSPAETTPEMPFPSGGYQRPLPPQPYPGQAMPQAAYPQQVPSPYYVMPAAPAYEMEPLSPFEQFVSGLVPTSISFDIKQFGYDLFTKYPSQAGMERVSGQHDYGRQVPSQSVAGFPGFSPQSPSQAATAMPGMIQQQIPGQQALPPGTPLQGYQQMPGVPQPMPGALQQSTTPNSLSSVPSPSGYPTGTVLPGMPSQTMLQPGVGQSMAQGQYYPRTSAQATYPPVYPSYPGLPNLDVPVSPDYVLGPGDEVRVSVWGSIEGTWSAQIDRDGNLNLPKIGIISVANLTYQQLVDVLHKEISKYYTEFDMNVTMGPLKTIKVYVVGNARTPAAYNVPSLSTIINTLLVAGGPSKAGSMRNIQLKRGEKTIAELDLYDFLINGSRAKDERVMPEDVIFIPPIGPIVGVAGNVARPAIYELKGKTRLSQVIKMAGGVTAAASLQRVQVERVSHKESKIFLDLNLQQMQGKDDIYVQDGDIVKVFPISTLVTNKVTLQGNVKRPGDYEWRPGMRIKDILKSPDDLLPDTFMDYGILQRIVGIDQHQEYRNFSLQSLFASGFAEENIALEPLDIVTIFNTRDITQQKIVQVSGAVSKPGQFEFKPNMKLSDLLKLSGGLTQFAYTSSAELTRILVTQQGPRTEQIYVDLNEALAGNEEHDIFLHEHDHLLVRAVPEWQLFNKAYVYGEVRFPGEYSFNKGETLASLIERAGGYTEKAYVRGAVLTRTSAKNAQQIQINDMIERLERELFASTNVDVAAVLSQTEARALAYQTDQKRILIEGLRRIEAKGRLVVHLDDPNRMKNTSQDVTLEPNDTLVIPVNPQIIQVVGAVYNPSSFVYEPKKDYRFYIQKAGGFSRTADKKGTYVMKVDGTANKLSGGGLTWDKDSNRWVSGYSNSVEPGDSVVVPDKLANVPWLPIVKDFTQILYQIAVGAGVVFRTLD